MVIALLTTAALAGGGYDTNHPDVRWQTLETEHFFFHWPESKRARDDPHWFTTRFTTEKLAAIAEKSYYPIVDQFDYELEEKVHVVIYDQNVGWEGNGFAIAEWDWTGFAADWGPLFRMRGRMEFLSDVFVHEFAHIVSLKVYLPWSEASTGFQLGGLVEDEEYFDRIGIKPPVRINPDIAFDLVFTAHTPFWWAEGGAEYWSEEAGYNQWGTSRDAFLRMSVLEDRVLGMDEWTTRIDKHGFDGERGYNHGYAFGRYLRDRFDRDIYSETAQISRGRWHWSWDRVMEEATGVPMEDLYWGWRDHLAAHYGAQKAVVDERGLVAGRELSLIKRGWEFPDEDWDKLSKKKQEQAMDGPTAWMELSKYSPDSAAIAWFDRGLNVMQITPVEWGAIGGTYFDPDDAKQMKALDKRTSNTDWVRYLPVGWSADSNKLVVVGGEDDNVPDFARHQGLTFDADGYNWNQLYIGTLKHGKRLEIDWEPVPNSLRATEAAFSPDGTQLAFARYGDGTHELWTMNVDGSGAVQHTHFGDGTQIQGIHYTSDGQSLVMGLYREDRQDIWQFSLGDSAAASGKPSVLGSFRRITDSKADELDPTLGPDDTVWFASDVDGIYNVYSLDLDTGETRKHTELYGGAYGPDVTAEGHLTYTAFTGHGYRIRMVNAAALKQQIVDYPGVCVGDNATCGDNVEAALATRPPEGGFAATDSVKYNPLKSQMPFSMWPISRTTDKNVEIGSGFFLGDYAEKHMLEGELTFGKDNYLALSYWNSQLWPNIALGYGRYAYKGTYGYGIDLDDVPETDKLSVVDVKFEQVSDDVYAFVSYSPSYYVFLGAGADMSVYSFREAGDGANWSPYVVNTGIGTYLEWSPRDAWYDGDDWINPRGGRRVYADYSYRWTQLVDPETSGGVYDDGQLLERYHFNKFFASWTEFIPVPGTDHHTLQLDFEAGFVDRNVMGWDEMIAGGRHPYSWGNGTIGNNIQFSGYEGWSLTGETMLIANGSYRFPLVKDMHVKTGPIYWNAVYLQGFGTIGNLWSYRPVGQTHLEGYSVVSDSGRIRREVPFRDFAAKNSPPGKRNYFLEDAGAEVRVRAFIWNDFDWDSFIRFAYGFKATAGYGDVNADFVQSSLARSAGTELSGEQEPPTLRVYMGIGTGW